MSNTKSLELHALGRARGRIAVGPENFICYALRGLVDREIQDSLTFWIEDNLYPNISLEGYAASKGLNSGPVYLRYIRLKWLDKMINIVENDLPRDKDLLNDLF